MNDLEKEILKRIDVSRSKRYITNCYSLDVVNGSSGMWTEGDDFVFSYLDHGVMRLVYFVEDWSFLDKLLEKIEGGRFYLEFLTRNPSEYVPSYFSIVARMKRLSNSDCRTVFDADSPLLKYKNVVSVQSARYDDAEEINEILWTTFRTEISHLLSIDEVRKRIESSQFFIHKDNRGGIDALLQADVLPRKFYINQIVNRAGKEVIHSLLLNRLEKYVSEGGRYLYAWVQDSNIPSLKFHEKYGMKHDGMWSMIYSLERT